MRAPRPGLNQAGNAFPDISMNMAFLEHAVLLAERSVHGTTAGAMLECASIMPLQERQK
jgi:hypothetical protein